MTRLLAAAIAAASVLAAGCGDDNAPGPGTLDVALPVGGRVAMVDIAFDPEEVRVSAGELVEFTNRSELEHTVTSDPVLFDSGRILPGERFTYLTDTEGSGQVIDYHCEVHPERMTGRIVVEGKADNG